MAIDIPPPPPQPAAIVAPAQAETAPVVVDSNGYRYSVVGNTFLSPEAIAASLANAEDPKAALDALNRAYQLAGYMLVALRGEVQGKLVAIYVISGKVSEIDISPKLVPFFTGVIEREGLKRSTYIRNSVLAEAYSARQGMTPKVNFSPGSQVGATKLTVTEDPIPDAKPWNASLGFNNLGSRFSSRYVAQAAASARPGNGWEFTGNYVYGLTGLSDESAGSLYHQGGAGLSRITPWGLYGATYSQTHYRIGEVAAPVFPEGDIKILALSGTQLAYADETTRWGFAESFTRVSNVSTAFEGTFPLQDQHYGVVAVGTNISRTFSLFGESATAGAGITVSRGISGRSGTFQPEQPGVPDPRFTAYQLNATYTQLLPRGFNAGVSFTGQWAGATLPQSQQWVLGGFGNLTAYVPAVLVGDSGALLRATVSTPPWTWGDFSVSGGVFVEGGVAWSHVTPVNTPVTRGLSDAGLSVSGALTSGTTVTLAYATPWASHNASREFRDSLARANLYFSLNQSF